MNKLNIIYALLSPFYNYYLIILCMCVGGTSHMVFDKYTFGRVYDTDIHYSNRSVLLLQ